MSEKLITLATYDQGIKAHLDRIRLESEGIDCFILDELTGRYFNGIKLQVRASDYERAKKILHRKLARLYLLRENPDDSEKPA